MTYRCPAPPAALAALLGFVAVVVASSAWLALAAHALLVAALTVALRIPPRWLLQRFAVAIPFLAFAALLPVVALGPKVQFGPLSLSPDAAASAALISARILISVGAATVFAWHVGLGGMVDAVAGLRAPHLIVDILNLMVRYSAIVLGNLDRMSIACAARGDPRRRLARLAASGALVGALFVRSYERGERVYLAMLARGYGPHNPRPATQRVPALDWMVAAAFPLAALGALLAALAVVP